MYMVLVLVLDTLPQDLMWHPDIPPGKEMLVVLKMLTLHLSRVLVAVVQVVQVEQHLQILCRELVDMDLIMAAHSEHRLVMVGGLRRVVLGHAIVLGALWHTLPQVVVETILITLLTTLTVMV
jgi:hypothetical protein